jgi:hypothetical protein
MVQIHAPGSTAHVGFRTPLAFLPLSGGGPESGAHLSNGSYQRARINGDEDHSGPPPPAFLPLSRGGGSGIPYAAFRRPRSRRSDQRRSCSPTLLSCPVLNQCGPSSRHFIFPSAFSLPPCVIHSPPPLWSAWSYLLLTTHSFLATCPTPFHVSLSPVEKFIPLVFLPFT